MCAFSIKYFAINTVEKIFDSIFLLKKNFTKFYPTKDFTQI
ncbi:hypothetical protein [uncultured Gammaproteobacteria bacterium]|nr:hypothetical protein [uncultured Gammaproteobacteria bacterium]CAC9629852.1 hypothetical protein [uncultured Gammaproteobacteria bacterium]